MHVMVSFIYIAFISDVHHVNRWFQSATCLRLITQGRPHARFPARTFPNDELMIAHSKSSLTATLSRIWETKELILQALLFVH